MSATIDTDGLDRLSVRAMEAVGKRFPVWRHNTGRPIDECIVDIAETALVRQDLGSPYFPRPAGQVERDIIASIIEQGRAKGMLVMVNSFSGERSDARRIERLLLASPMSKHFKIGLLASEVLRDPERREAYEAMLENWKKKRERYVLIATSVVEMGVTLPDLDFIVTMDSDLEDSEDGGLRRVPLRTNALIQRFGRVGRLRPGIAYVTRDIEAPFSAWDDATLNAPDALQPEPIRFPMATSPLIHLAHATLSLDWDDDVLEARIAELKLPTDILSSPERITKLRFQRVALWELGVRWGVDTTDVGRRLGFWLGRIESAFAVEAHAAFDSDDPKGVLRALCKGVLAEIPLETVCNPERFQHVHGADAPKEDIYRAFIPWLTTWLNTSMTHGYTRHRIAERILEAFLRREINEAAFSRALAFLSDLIDNFIKVVGREDVDQTRLARLRKYRDTIGSFHLLRS